MAANSSIEWTHHTFNPWRGCTKVSAGCKNCYAETLSGRNPKALGVWGPGGTRVVAAESYWKQPLKWNEAARAAGERHRVFCASLADVFERWDRNLHRGLIDGDDIHPPENAVLWHSDDFGICDAGKTTAGLVRGERLATLNDVRLRLFDLIRRATSLDFLLLTKRPENVMPMLREVTRLRDAQTCGNDRDPLIQWLRRWICDQPPANVWLGTSVEDQDAADNRIPHLLQSPALVRFLSCEPLLGPVDLDKNLGGTRWIGGQRGCGATHRGLGTPDCPREPHHHHDDRCRPGIDGVIVGGESGHGARPMHPDWARRLRDQCVATDTAFFFKQWGDWVPYKHDAQPPFLTSQAGDMVDGHRLPHDLTDRINETVDGWMLDESLQLYRRVGKKAAGRLLDGQAWDELPATRHTVGAA